MSSVPSRPRAPGREGRYDAGIRRAVRELNRVAGVRTRSSCQGKAFPDERSTHSDLAYVLFRSPVPLAFEEHLEHSAGEFARIEPDSLYSRWPTRNQEFCDRVADLAGEFQRSRSARPARERRLALETVLRPIETALRSAGAANVDWCFACGCIHGEDARDCDPALAVPLISEPASRRLAAFEAFLAADPHPPDARLREREGDAAVLDRLERGDFGDAYRRKWERFVARHAREVLRTDVRSGFAARRAEGRKVDLYFSGGKVVFVES